MGDERSDDEHIRGQIWRDGERVDGFDIAKISGCLDEKNTLIWADLECPSHDTLARLAAELDLDPFAVEDTTAAVERVKTVTYTGHTFMMVYAITMNDDEPQDDSDSPPPAALSLIHI